MVFWREETEWDWASSQQTLVKFENLTNILGEYLEIFCKLLKPFKSVGKFVEENWSYLPGVYNFRDDAEIPEIFRKKWKRSIFQEILSKNIKISLNLFKMLSVLVQKRMFALVFWNFHCALKTLVKLDYLEFLYEVQSISCKILKNFHLIFANFVEFLRDF